MRSPLQFLLAATLTATMVACQKDDATIETTSGGETNISASADSASARGNAMVRFINVADATRMASLQIDGTTLFDSVKATSVTDFREVSQTRGHFTARLVGTNDTATVASGDKTLMDGNRYSVVMLSENMATRVLRVVQDEVIPDSGMARIRVLHAASGGPAIDVRAVNGTENLFSGVTFESEAGYKDVQPSTLALQVRTKDTDTVLLTLAPMTLTRGTATTIVIYGATKLAAFVFTDAMMPAMAGR